MIVKLAPDHTEQDIESIQKLASKNGLHIRTEVGTETTVICLLGTFNGKYDQIMGNLQAMPHVEEVLKISKPYKLAKRMDHRGDTHVRVGDVEFGGDNIVLIAGPCAVENETRMMSIAEQVREAGAHMLRGGAYKPRTGPHSFQGLRKKGLRMLQKAGRENSMPTVTEVMEPGKVGLVAEFADMLQIGARNMQNYKLLQKVGKSGKPTLLKRGPSATYEELLLAAEYILNEGNPNVVLCERGIRTAVGPEVRNTLDLAAVPVIKDLSHLPIIVDPSHGVGVRKYIPDAALAAIAIGADGVHIEVHDKPEEALSDGPQSLLPKQYVELVQRMRTVAASVHRTIA